MSNPAPIPFRDRITMLRNPRLPAGQPDPQEGMLSQVWMDYISDLVNVAWAATSIVGGVRLSAQNASIAATAIPALVLVDESYRVSYYARVTTVAGVTSSLTLAFTWTDGGVVQTETIAALTTNLTTSNTKGTFPITCDSGTTVTYATTYASNAASVMQYSLSVILEEMAF